MRIRITSCKIEWNPNHAALHTGRFISL